MNKMASRNRRLAVMLLAGSAIFSIISLPNLSSAQSLSKIPPIPTIGQIKDSDVKTDPLNVPAYEKEPVAESIAVKQEDLPEELPEVTPDELPPDPADESSNEAKTTELSQKSSSVITRADLRYDLHETLTAKVKSLKEFASLANKQPDTKLQNQAPSAASAIEEPVKTQDIKVNQDKPAIDNTLAPDIAETDIPPAEESLPDPLLAENETLAEPAKPENNPEEKATAKPQSDSEPKAEIKSEPKKDRTDAVKEPETKTEAKQTETKSSAKENVPELESTTEKANSEKDSKEATTPPNVEQETKATESEATKANDASPDEIHDDLLQDPDENVTGLDSSEEQSPDEDLAPETMITNLLQKPIPQEQLTEELSLILSEEIDNGENLNAIEFNEESIKKTNFYKIIEKLKKTDSLKRFVNSDTTTPTIDYDKIISDQIIKINQLQAAKIAEAEKIANEADATKQIVAKPKGALTSAEKQYLSYLDSKAKSLPQSQQFSNKTKSTLDKISKAIVESRPVKSYDERAIEIDHFKGADTILEDGVTKTTDSTIPMSLRQNTMSNKAMIDVTLSKAHKALVSGQIEAAIYLYKQVLDLDKNNKQAKIGLATGYQRNGQIEQARDLYTKILSEDPQNSEVLNNFLSLAAIESPENALVELKKLERISPELSIVPAQIAMIHINQNRPEMAERYLKRAYRMAPNNMSYLFNLAVISDQIKQYPQAIYYYKELIDRARDGQTIPGSVVDIEKRMSYLKRLAGDK